MRVNWLTYTDERNYDRVESTLWIRGYQLFPYLERLGITCLMNASPGAASVAVMLRWQDARALEAARAVKRAGGKVISDFCVNYFDESVPTGGTYGAFRAQVNEAAAMVQVADVLTCASANIAARARHVHPRVEYLPDSIDERHFSHMKSAVDFNRPRLRAAWSGVRVKAGDLRPILRLLRRHGFTLTVISDADPLRRWSPRWLYGKLALRYRYVPWHYDTFPAAIRDAELCVSPRDLASPYNRGHSFFKIGVFMAEGVPAIASPVPSYAELIVDGRGGALCADTPAWDAALAKAAGDRKQLAAWSREARNALHPFSTERVAQRYASLFHELLGHP